MAERERGRSWRRTVGWKGLGLAVGRQTKPAKRWGRWGRGGLRIGQVKSPRMGPGGQPHAFGKLGRAGHSALRCRTFRRNRQHAHCRKVTRKLWRSQWSASQHFIKSQRHSRALLYAPFCRTVPYSTSTISPPPRALGSAGGPQARQPPGVQRKHQQHQVGWARGLNVWRAGIAVIK